MRYIPSAGITLVQLDQDNKEMISPDDLNIDVSPRLTILKTEEPTERSAGIILENIDELAEKIKTQAGV